jgi:ABC-2 type transport system ATP-binding protein
LNVIEFKRVSKNYKRYIQSTSLKSVLKELIKREYKNVYALKNVNFEIEKGEKVALLGPNGSGKSTTMKLLSGILTPTTGHLLVNNHVPYKRSKSFLKEISLIMGQKTQLWWDLPAMDTFLLMKYIYEIPESEFQERLKFLLGGFQIEHLINIQVRKLSLGERMKMEIISMLLHNPKVLLLDEPTIGLDFNAQKSIRKMLNEYNTKFNTTIILTSHYLNDITSLCDRVLVLNKGELIFDGSLEKLKADFTCYLKVTLKFSEPNSINWKEISEKTFIENDKIIIQITKNKLFQVLELAKQTSLEEFFVEEPSIEDSLIGLFDHHTL